MTQPFAIYFGDIIEQESERAFLDMLVADLTRNGLSGTLLANFTIKRHQIDFVVLTKGRCLHIELKAVAGPIFGDKNGPWSLGGAGETSRRSFYQQALQQKYELSDALLDIDNAGKGGLFSATNKPYKYIESFVCVFPALHPDSRVYADDWVRVVGYSELIKAFAEDARAPRQPWRDDYWVLLRQRLQLRSHEEYLPFTHSERHSTEPLASYTNAFRDYHALMLKDYVEPALQRGDAPAVATDILRKLASRKPVALCGTSGAGKTFAVTKIAVDSLQHGFFPAIASAGKYRGKLSVLLTNSISPFTAHDWHSLAMAASEAKAIPLVLLDGIDDCPRHLRNDLRRDVLSLMQQTGSVVCVTCSTADEYLGLSDDTTFTIAAISEAFRDALVQRLAGSGLSQAVRDFVQQMSTPLEIRLAIECADDLPPSNSSLSDVVGVYLRKCLEATAGYSFGRRLLGMSAYAMCERFRSSIGIEELFEMAHSMSGDHDSLDAKVESLSHDVRLLEVVRGEVSFRHDVFREYCAASHLRSTASAKAPLDAVLADPRFSGLSRQVISRLNDRDIIGSIVASCSQIDPLLAVDAASGKLGDLAQSIVSGCCDSYIEYLEGVAKSFEIPSDSVDASTGLCEILFSDIGSDDALRVPGIDRCIRSGLARGERLSRVMRLVGDTEEAFLERLAAAAPESDILAIRARALWWLYYCGPLPIARIVAANAPFFETRPASNAVSYVDTCAQSLAGRSAGELSLLLQLLPYRWVEVERAVPRIPILIEACLVSRVPFVQQQAMVRLQQWAWQGDASRGLQWQRLRDMLGTFRTTREAAPVQYQVDCFVATADGAKPSDVDRCREQAIAIAQEPRSAAASEKAAAWLTGLIEAPDATSYGKAFDILDKGTKERLLAYACHAMKEYASWSAFAIAELFVAGADTEEARSAFRIAAARTPKLDVSPQEATDIFVTGVRGCARTGVALPFSDERSEGIARVWQLIGIIIFKGEQQPSDPQWRAECDRLWEEIITELVWEAASPLRELASIGVPPDACGNYAIVVQRLFRVFSDRIGAVLSMSARMPDKITSALIMAGFQHDKQDVLQFCLNTLGQLRYLSAKPIVEKYLSSDSPKLQREAATAIKLINNGGVFDALQRMQLSFP